MITKLNPIRRHCLPIASRLKKVYRQFTGGKALFWHTLEDEGTNDNPEGHFGLAGCDVAGRQSHDECGVMAGS